LCGEPRSASFARKGCGGKASGPSTPTPVHVVAVARVVNELFQPVKLNYEIHGNTIPHLHLHLFPRYVGDPFEGGPIQGDERSALHSRDDLERMATAFAAALRGEGSDR
jgi:hypothetical protein